MTSSAETNTMPEQRIEVALHHRFIGEPAEARQREHAFDHHRSAQHGAGLQPDQRHHRQQRVAQHVPRHHAGLVEAFGARGPDVIEVEHLQHRGAHDAQIDRQEDQPERQRRQHQMAGDIEHAPDAGAHRADVLEAAGRQPLQIDREHDDRHQPEPERGRGVEDQAERRDQRIRPAVDAARGDHAEHAARRRTQRTATRSSAGWSAAAAPG